MLIKDNIYGEALIKDQVLIDLIKTDAMQRLKTVSQYGVPDRYFNLKNFYRFEHSVGVMLLLRKMGASLDEQIAGLLHDVSHSAFSHVIDFVFGQGEVGEEDYQDLGHREFILQTDIPAILSKYNLDTEKIVNEANFPLLENNVPNICADRIDYSLREFKSWLNPGIVATCLAGLIVYNDEIVFCEQESASLFANNFMELQVRNWGSEETVRRVYLLSRVLKIAYQAGVLLKKDFYSEEEQIIRKIEAAEIPAAQAIISRLTESRIVVENGSKRIVKKFRHVNPKVLIAGEIRRFSEISPEFNNKLEKYRELNAKGVFVE